MQRELERLFERVVFGPEPEPDACRALFSGLPAADAGELAASFDRLCVYRRLVRGTLREAIELALPRTVARLGALFDEYFDRFLAEQGPRSHFLRDVTPEFLSFCADPWKSDERLPAWTHDLARHESLRIEVGAQPVQAPGEPFALALDRGVHFSEACRLMLYDFAVHELPDDVDDRGAPRRESTRLFVYRSPEHEVRYLALSSLAYAILRRLLLHGEPLGAALRGAAGELGVALDDDVLSGSARLLADLAERGALLGALEPDLGSRTAAGP